MRLAFLCSCAVALVGCASPPEPPDASAGPAAAGLEVAGADTVFGQLLVVWIDARDGTPESPEFSAVDSAGASVRLIMDPALLAPLGGVTRTQRSWLSFVGRLVGGDPPTLRVESVSREQDPGG